MNGAFVPTFVKLPNWSMLLFISDNAKIGGKIRYGCKNAEKPIPDLKDFVLSFMEELCWQMRENVACTVCCRTSLHIWRQPKEEFPMSQKTFSLNV